MSKVAIYARVSTVENQDYQRQISDLKSVIKSSPHKNFKVDIYAEKLSGYKKRADRTELSALLDITKSKNNPYKCIYVTEISRIGRNPSEARAILDELTELGIPVYIHSLKRATVDKDGKRDFVVNIILQVLLEFANVEAETLRERSKSGLLHSVTQGRVGGGVLPYGYAKGDENKMVINDLEAKIVEGIFSDYRSGMGTKAIANKLNDLNIPTKWNNNHQGVNKKFTFSGIEKEVSQIKWSDSVILSIIKNTLYFGERKFKGQIIKCPAIISKEIFDSCAEIRTTKSHRNYLTTYEYLLKDILKCGVCKRNYFAKYKPVPGGDKVYICSSRLIKGNNCGNCGINISFIESVLYNELKNSKLIQQKSSSKTDTIALYDSKLSEIKKERNILEKNISVLNGKLSRLIDIYLDSNDSKEILYVKKVELENAIKNQNKKFELLTKKINELQLAKVKANESNENQYKFENALRDRLKLKALFDEFIEKVFITKVDGNIMLMSLQIKIDGIPYYALNHYELFTSGIRKKSKIYQYRAVTHMEKEWEYEHITDPLLKEVQNDEFVLTKSLFVKFFDFFNNHHFDHENPIITIPQENYLYIAKSDL